MTQSASTAQLVLQVVVPQTNIEQGTVEAWLQVPEPEQTEGGWWVVPLHDSARPQATVFAACVQAPAPLQVPVLPQGGLAAQPPCGSATVPTLAQVPPAPVQTWQTGQLALPQQRPSTQFPLLHWLAPLHVAPLACFATQAPPLQ